MAQDTSLATMPAPRTSAGGAATADKATKTQEAKSTDEACDTIPHLDCSGCDLCRGTYTGERRDGKKHGVGTFVASRGVVYEGEWRNDYQHGKGKTTWPNGQTHEGEYQDSKRHGIGKITFIQADGSTQALLERANAQDGVKNRVVSYYGDFRNNKKEGRGQMTWQDGQTYEGDFHEDRLTGKGVKTWKCGSVYDGEWLNGKRHGFGKHTWAKGDIYEGEWSTDKAHGKGKYTAKTDKGSVHYEGDFVNSKRHGRGTTDYGSGTKYVGDYVEDKQHGDAEFTSFDGWSYKGAVVLGRPTAGVFTDSKGQRFEVQYDCDCRELPFNPIPFSKKQILSGKDGEDGKAEEKSLSIDTSSAAANDTVRQSLRAIIMCPISHSVMLDPVKTFHGNTYDLKSLVGAWNKSSLLGFFPGVPVKDPVTRMDETRIVSTDWQTSRLITNLFPDEKVTTREVGSLIFIHPSFPDGYTVVRFENDSYVRVDREPIPSDVLASIAPSFPTRAGGVGAAPPLGGTPGRGRGAAPSLGGMPGRGRGAAPPLGGMPGLGRGAAVPVVPAPASSSAAAGPSGGARRVVSLDDSSLDVLARMATEERENIEEEEHSVQLALEARQAAADAARAVQAAAGAARSEARTEQLSRAGAGQQVQAAVDVATGQFVGKFAVYVCPAFTVTRTDTMCNRTDTRSRAPHSQHALLGGRPCQAHFGFSRIQCLLHPEGRHDQEDCQAVPFQQVQGVGHVGRDE